MEFTLGDGPIQPEYLQQINAVAHAIDEFLNPGKTGDKRETFFVVIMGQFGAPGVGRCNYMSNCDRKDVVQLLKDQLRLFEGN